MDDTKRSETGYSFKLLQEEASESDLFPDKTHEEVKNTLFNLIETSEKGITIGLEGGWGSGKTTVINFLNAAIKKSKKKTLFFSFDAWAHEGDPLRRIFLESLINEIDPENKDETLNKLLKEISGRKKIVEVKTVKETSKFAYYLAIAALLVPVGAALLSALNYDKLVTPWSSLTKSASYPIIFGLLFSFAPALIVLYWWIWGEKDKDGKPKWGLILSNSTENYTQDITEDGERSSIEFEKYFQKILEHSVSNNKNKKYERAIIVVDNLDRVDATHANQLWSTLQTFFQHRSKKKDDVKDWMECLWFIVPYDREGLSKIWITKNDDNEEGNSQNVAQSFLNKCFQIRAEVPAPVMSAWNEYTIKSVNNSLENWPETERETVIRTYKRYSSRLDMSPTPREINNFVNQVGFIGMRWGGIMSTEAISLYATLRKEYSERTLRNQLLSLSDLPDGFEAIGNKQTIKQELAGLLFGVSKEKGIELLLKPEINRSISSGNGEILKDLIQIHGEAFWITWYAIKKDIIPTDSHSEEYKIAATKSISTGMSDYFNRIKFELADLEKVWRRTSDNWNFINLDYSESLSAISNFSEDKPAFIDWLNQITSTKLKKLIEKLGVEPEISANELEQFSYLTKFLSKNNKPLTRFHYSHLDATNWSIWLNTLIVNKISLPTVLPAKGAIEAIGTQYLANNTTLPEDNLTLLLDTYKVHPDSNEWVSVISNLVTWANRTNRDLNSDLAYQLMLNLYAFNNTQSKALIKTCVAGQQFWTRGKQETIDSVPTLPLLVGSVLGNELQNNTFLNAAIHSYWSEKDNSTTKINHAFDTLLKANQLKAFWDIAKDEKNIFAVDVLMTKTESSELYSLKEAVLSLNNYSNWFDNKQHSRIILQLCECGAVDKALDTLKNEPLNYDYSLYLLQNYGNTNVINLINKFLPSINSEIWVSSFEDNNYLLNCALNDEVKLDHKYTDAFKGFFSISMHNSDASEWQWKHFDDLLKKTVDRNILLNELATKFFEDDEDTLNEIVFSTLSKHISNHVKHVPATKLMMRLCHWIDNKEWSRIEWLVNSKLKIKESPLEGLSSRINDAFNNEENRDRRLTIKEIANLFNIEIINTEDNKPDLE